MQGDLLVDKQERRDPGDLSEKLDFVCVMSAWGSNTDNTSESTTISLSLLSAILILQGACGNLPFKLCFPPRVFG